MKPGVDDAPLDYDEICRRRDVAVSELLNEVDRLRKAKKFDQVEAALVAFLKHRGQKAEPWMYELLALALEANKRDDWLGGVFVVAAEGRGGIGSGGGHDDVAEDG
jgi:hypothetical protein